MASNDTQRRPAALQKNDVTRTLIYGDRGRKRLCLVRSHASQDLQSTRARREAGAGLPAGIGSWLIGFAWNLCSGRSISQIAKPEISSQLAQQREKRKRERKRERGKEGGREGERQKKAREREREGQVG